MSSKKKEKWEWFFLIPCVLGVLAIIAVVAYIGVTSERTVDGMKNKEGNEGEGPGEETLVKFLRREIAPSDASIVKITNFTNAIKNVFVQDVILVEPKSLEQLQATVKAASQRKIKLRAVGAAHSFANVWVDSGQILVSMKQLNRGTGHRIQFNPVSFHDGLQSVSVIAGVDYEELDDFLIKNNITLKTGINYLNPTVVGTVAGCAHGSGKLAGDISDYVIAMRIVDGRGQLRSYNSFQHPHIMRALQCCIGMCGIIYDITIQVFNMRVARELNFYKSVEESLYNTTYLADLVKKHDSVIAHSAILSSLNQSQWDFVHSNMKLPRNYRAKLDDIWFRVTDAWDEFQSQTPKERVRHYPPPPPTGPPSTTLQEQILDAIEAIDVYFKAHINNRTDYWYMPDALRYGDADQPWNFHTTDMGLFIQDDWSFQKTKKVVQVMMAQMESLLYKSVWSYPYVTYSFRWYGTSGCYLCPANSNGPVTLAFYPVGIPNDPRYQPAVTEIFQEVKKFAPDIRVHWVKQWNGVPNIQTHIKNSFAGGLKKVLDIRQQEKFDPERIFVNKMFKDIFE